MSAPHNGDRLRIEATAGPGSDLHITTISATIALPGRTAEPATYDVALTVADGARLHWVPEPLISTVDSELHQTLLIDLAPTARLILREEHLLGRCHEPPGRVTNRLTVRRDGTTILDQQTAYGPGTPGWDGPAVLAGNRALGQVLIVDPAFDTHPQPVHLLGDDPAHAHGVLVPLAGAGALATATAPDALELRHCLDTLLRQGLAAQPRSPGPG
jgi:urease accessory protein